MTKFIRMIRLVINSYGRFGVTGAAARKRGVLLDISQVFTDAYNARWPVAVSLVRDFAGSGVSGCVQ